MTLSEVMSGGAVLPSLPVIEWDGKPISKPGIYRNVPIKVYHGQLTVGPSVSRSGLWRLFNRSPRHFFAESYLNPRPVAVPENEALLLGRAAHHVILGEKDFRSHFVSHPEVYPEGVDYGEPVPYGTKLKPWNLNSNWCKAWMRDHRENDPRDIIEPKHIDQIKGMALGLADEPLVQRGALNGLVEHTLVWRDEKTGVWVKIRPDVIPTADDDASDLKTCADITDDGLEEAVGRDGLFLQGAMTDIAWRQLLGRPLGSFSFVFIEKTAPYCARVRQLNGLEIELGHRTFRCALDLFARCLADDNWPGPGGATSDMETLTMKPFHRQKIERRLHILGQELSE